MGLVDGGNVKTASIRLVPDAETKSYEMFHGVP